MVRISFVSCTTCKSMVCLKKKKRKKQYLRKPPTFSDNAKDFKLIHHITEGKGSFSR